jgi:hypothetical protein
MLKRTLHGSAGPSAPVTPPTYAPGSPTTPTKPTTPDTPDTPAAKRARLATRASARFKARVIDLSSDSPFAFVDLTCPTPSSPEYAEASDFSDGWGARVPVLLSPRLNPPASPALLASPGPAWDAQLDELKARLPALHSAFIRKLTAAAPPEPAPDAACDAAAPVVAAFDGSTDFTLAHAAAYVAHLPRWASASESVEIAAHIYVERMCARAPGLAPRPRNVRRLFAVALLLSCKMHEEIQYRMVHWAHHCGGRLRELLALERQAMNLLEWNLYVSPAELEAFVARLQ